MSAAVNMAPVLLIASAAFVDEELVVEFGRLPPAFLPLGNRRLYTHQHGEFGGTVSRILLSVPETFVIGPMDVERLDALGIEVVPVPEHLSLGESVVYVINVSAVSGAPVMLIHGDTLLRGLDVSIPDSVSVESEPQPDYQWGGVVLEGDYARVLFGDGTPADAVLTGFFRFSDCTRLVQCITREGGSFLKGLRAYGDFHRLRALRSRDWFDFGHARTYHRSRRRVTTERAFNSLTGSLHSVTKSGSNANKIEAEARWFEALPQELRLYSPVYLGRRNGDGAVAYALEYMHLPTLADLFVFGRLHIDVWRKVFVACEEVLDAMAQHVAPQDARQKHLPDMYLNKTLERLEAYSRASGVDIEAPCRFAGGWLPSLSQMARLAASAVAAFDSADSRLIHGDFCFSNLLYDGRAGLIRMIDPRGLDSVGEFSVWGDPRYDIAKMHHSVVGLYDHIIAGNFRLHEHGALDVSLDLPDDKLVRAIGSEFMSRSFGGLRPPDCDALPISVLLFFSMLPLHADDPQRQRALMANGMRLFSTIDEMMS
jgi:hypothetical protein